MAKWWKDNDEMKMLANSNIANTMNYFQNIGIIKS
jgi:hypothetical protein